MNWKEEAAKHTEYTRRLVKLASTSGMVSIDCAMYLYEQALIHGWKHAEEHLLGPGRNDLSNDGHTLVDGTSKAEFERSLRKRGIIAENDCLGDEFVIEHDDLAYKGGRIPADQPG